MQRIRRPALPHVAVISAAGILLLLLGLFKLRTPYIFDEVYYVLAAESLATNGRPVILFDTASGPIWTLWHPPAYIASISIAIATFGSSELVVRGATLLFTLATVPVVYATAYVLQFQISERILSAWTSPTWQIPALAAFGYVLAPLTIQNAVLIDIDGSILEFLTAGFFLWFVYSTGRGFGWGYREYGVLAIWFAVLPWAKFGILPAIALVIGIPPVVTRDIAHAVKTGLSVILGLMAFSATWWIASRLLGYPFWMPFEHNVFTVLSGTDGGPASFRILLSGWTLFTEALWLSPFLVGLALYGVWLALKPDNAGHHRSLRDQTAITVLLPLGLFVFLSMTQYAVLGKLAAGFPKYLGPAMPALIVLAVLPVATSLPTPNENRTFWGTMLAASILVSVVIVGLPDPFKAPFQDGHGAVLRHAIALVAQLILITIVVAGAGSLLVRLRARSTIAPRRVAVATLLVLALGWNGGLLVTHLTADYSTTYFYGDSGWKQTVEVVETAGVYDPTIVGPKNVRYYVDGTYYFIETYSVDMLREQQPAIIVHRVDRYYRVSSPLLRELKQSEAYEEQIIGSYGIYRKSSASENRSSGGG